MKTDSATGFPPSRARRNARSGSGSIAISKASARLFREPCSTLAMRGTAGFRRCIRSVGQTLFAPNVERRRSTANHDHIGAVVPPVVHAAVRFIVIMAALLCSPSAYTVDGFNLPDWTMPTSPPLRRSPAGIHAEVNRDASGRAGVRGLDLCAAWHAGAAWAMLVKEPSHSSSE